MCVVSMVGDHFAEKWKDYFPQQSPPLPGIPSFTPSPLYQLASAADLEALKKEVAEMKELLIKAKIYDEKTNQKDCQKEEKVAILKKMAEFFGVSLEDVFGK